MGKKSNKTLSQIKIVKKETIPVVKVEKKVQKDYEEQTDFLSELENEQDDLLALVSQVKNRYKEQESTLRHFQKEISNAVSEVEKETIKLKSSTNLTKEMILATMLPAAAKPLRGIAAVAMNAVVTMALVMDMLSFEEERTTEIVIEVEDLTMDLVATIDDIKEIGTNLEKGIHITEDLLKEVSTKFSDYKHTKEYNKLVDQVEEIQQTLKKNQNEFHIILLEQEENLKTNENQLKLVKK